MATNDDNAKYFSEWIKERQIELTDSFEQFAVGQLVSYENQAGLTNDHYILGIRKEPEGNGRRFYLDKDSFWYAVSPNTLTRIT